MSQMDLFQLDIRYLLRWNRNMTHSLCFDPHREYLSIQLVVIGTYFFSLFREGAIFYNYEIAEKYEIK